MITEAEKRNNMIAILVEANRQLSEDYERVKTEHGKSTIYTEIYENETQLSKLLYESPSTD